MYFFSISRLFLQTDVVIGRMPIMLRSCCCVLYGKDEAELAKLGWCVFSVFSCNKHCGIYSSLTRSCLFICFYKLAYRWMSTWSWGLFYCQRNWKGEVPSLLFCILDLLIFNMVTFYVRVLKVLTSIYGLCALNVIWLIWSSRFFSFKNNFLKIGSSLTLTRRESEYLFMVCHVFSLPLIFYHQ